MHHYPGPGGGMGSSMLFGLAGFVGTLLLLGLLALLVIYLVRKSNGKKFEFLGANPMGGGPQHHRPPMPPALQILDERLANGDIEVEDYMTRKAALLGERNPAANEWTPQASTPPSPQAAQPPTDDPVI